MYSVTSLPATSIRRMLLGIANPSYTGTACDTPSPESKTIPVVRPDAYSESTACIEVKRAGTLNVSKSICAAVSRLARGFSGASVRRTGCWQNNAGIVSQVLLDRFELLPEVEM